MLAFSRTWWAPWRVHWPPVRVRCPVALSLSATFAHERPAPRCSIIAASVFLLALVPCPAPGDELEPVGPWRRSSRRLRTVLTTNAPNRPTGTPISPTAIAIGNCAGYGRPGGSNADGRPDLCAYGSPPCRHPRLLQWCRWPSLSFRAHVSRAHIVSDRCRGHRLAGRW